MSNNVSPDPAAQGDNPDHFTFDLPDSQCEEPPIAAIGLLYPPPFNTFSPYGEGAMRECMQPYQNSTFAAGLHPYVAQHREDDRYRASPQHYSSHSSSPPKREDRHVQNIVASGADVVRNPHATTPSPLSATSSAYHRYHPYSGYSTRSTVASVSPTDGSERTDGTPAHTRIATAIMDQGLMEITAMQQHQGCDVLSSCEMGCTLREASKKEFSHLPGHDDQAFPGAKWAAKMSILLEFRLGKTYPSQKNQVTVLSTCKSGAKQPSKGRLAVLVAKQMSKYLAGCNQRNAPFPYTMDDIVLHRIDVVSKGTLRPRLYVRRPRPSPAATS